MRIHFIDIGGIGVSALARYFLAQRDQVSGSDAVGSEITEELGKMGAEIFIGQNTLMSSGNNLITSPQPSPSKGEEDNPPLRKGGENAKSPLTPLSKGGNGGIYSVIGKVKKDKRFKVYGLNGKLIINADIYELKEAWQKTLRW